MADADAVVVAAGRGGRPGESRLDLLRENAAIIGDIGSRLPAVAAPSSSSPIRLTSSRKVMHEVSGLPPARVLGTGTMLDTARLKQVVGPCPAPRPALHPRAGRRRARRLRGRSLVSAQSGASRCSAWPGWRPGREPAVAEEVRTAAYEIIRRKGATNHAIGLVTADLLRCLLRDERRVLTVLASRTALWAYGRWRCRCRPSWATGVPPRCSSRR